MRNTFQQGKSTRVYNFGEGKYDHGKNRFYTWNEWLKCIKYVKKV